MKCPYCDQLLQITERQNVETDYYPQCSGVWLDKKNWIRLSNFRTSKYLSYKKRDDIDDEKYGGYNSNQKKDDKYIDNRYHPNKYSENKYFLEDLVDFS